MGNKIIQQSRFSKWERPWNVEKFDDIKNRDERFFSILIKGVLSWLTRNIVMYNKPIKHFIFNTGSSIMYIESNGYEYSWNETTGEDWIYMERPRCVVTLGDIQVNTEELTQPYIRGTYERPQVERNDEGEITKYEISSFNAEITRIPITLSIELNYVLSNFNESVVLVQELLDKVLFQKYFSIVYLGQTIECSIEFPQSFHIEQNKIDMTSNEVNQKTITLSLNVCSNYPRIDENTEMLNTDVISQFGMNMKVTTDVNNNNGEYVKSIVQ